MYHNAKHRTPSMFRQKALQKSKHQNMQAVSPNDPCNTVDKLHDANCAPYWDWYNDNCDGGMWRVECEAINDAFYTQDLDWLAPSRMSLECFGTTVYDLSDECLGQFAITG